MLVLTLHKTALYDSNHAKLYLRIIIPMKSPERGFFYGNELMNVLKRVLSLLLIDFLLCS